MNIFSVLPNLIQWTITSLYRVMENAGPIATIGAFGIAVILTTLIIRTILFPLFAWQLRNSRRMQEQQRLIGPQLAEIRKKYKGQPQKMTEEMQKLYREHGMSAYSSLSGCLPMLVQLPVIYSLYGGIRGAVTALVAGGHHADVHFLWASDVSKSANQLAGATGPFPGSIVTDFAHPLVLIIPMLAGCATFIQSRMMMQPLRPNMTSQEQSMQNLSKQMSYIMPVMIFVLALGFPVGVSLYWVTQSAYMVVQQYYMIGWGGMKVPEWMPGSGRTTGLSYVKPVDGPSNGSMAMSDINSGTKYRSAGKAAPIAAAVANDTAATPPAIRRAPRNAKQRKRRR